MGGSDEIEGHPVSHLLKVAEKAVGDKTKNSVVMDVESEERIPKFQASGEFVSRTFAADNLKSGTALQSISPTVTLLHDTRIGFWKSFGTRRVLRGARNSKD